MDRKKLVRAIACGTALIVLSVGAYVETRKHYLNWKLHEALLGMRVMEAQNLVLAGAEDRCVISPEYNHLPVEVVIIQHGSRTVLEVLERRGMPLDKPLRTGEMPIDVAISANKPQIVRYLVERGVDVDAPYRVQRGPFPEQTTPLISAVSGMKTVPTKASLMRLLFDLGADVGATNGEGSTALHAANEVEIARELLRRRAPLEARDKGGRTPVLSALDFDRPQIVRLLVEAGAGINATDKQGRGVLHRAVAVDGSGESVKYFLAKGAKVRIKDAEGRTPLHEAVSRRATPAAVVLIAHGADPDARDAAGVTPRELANALLEPVRGIMIVVLAGGPLPSIPTLDPLMRSLN